MHRFVRLCIAAATLAVILSAGAQPFPARPVHVIVPVSPGGLNDLLVRNIGHQVAENIGQAVVVDNRPGAGTLVGMQSCANSAPDGYTVCVTTPESLTFNPLLFNKLPYDPDRDFAAVSLLTFGRGGVIVVSADTPGSSFPELIAYARANPGKLNYGSWGPGSLPAVFFEWISKQNGVSMVAVPYKGAGPVIPAILAGQVQATFTGVSLVMQHIKAGKLKLVAITGPRRSPMLPEVPSLAEFSSDPGLESYFGMFAPARTPVPVLERISAEFARAMHEPKLQEFLRSQFQEAAGMPPAEFNEYLKKDRANAARIFTTLGIKPGDAPS